MITKLDPSHQADLDRLDAEAPDWLGRGSDVATWAAPSGADRHTWGVRAGSALTAAARLSLGPRPRNRHTATLELVAAPDDDVAALIAAAVALADDWTPVDRIGLALPVGHAAVDAARALGFDVEATRRARLDDGRDEIALGRLRPGFVPRPPGPPPPWPRPARTEAPNFVLDDMTDADVPAVAALSTEDTVVWGTLQTPTSNLRFYEERHGRRPMGDFIGVLRSGDVVAGCASLHVTPCRDVRMLGMAVATSFQGRGAGHFLMAALLDRARTLDARRVELQVYEDNHRARALYAAHGFVPEGVIRCDAIRAGGHASSLDMAVVLREPVQSGRTRKSSSA